MEIITLFPVQHCLAEEALCFDIIHQENHRWILLDQLSNLVVPPCQYDQIPLGEVQISSHTVTAAAILSADAVTLEKSIEHLDELV